VTSFDSIRKEMLLDALRERISDRRVLRLIVGWMKAGVLAEGTLLNPETGTPQGGVLSPLLCNVVLHRLDRQWQAECRQLGVMVRYADDLVVLCPTKERAEAALAVLEAILAALGLKLAQAKTRLVDLRKKDQGFDFLGFHHRRVESFSKKGRYFCARWPCDRAVNAAKARIRSQTERRLVLRPVGEIIANLNKFLVGWRNYFRWGNSTEVFHDLDMFTAERAARFISKKHGRSGRSYGFDVLQRNGYLGLQHLVGSVRGSAVHAVR
jgi:RNA-directed DNA polymerase